MLKHISISVFIFSLLMLEPVQAQKRVLTVEELMEKNRPNEFRARENKEKYLVLLNNRGKRKRYFIGDIIICKTVYDVLFEEKIVDIQEGYFTLSYYDRTSSRPETRNIYLNEVSRIHRRPTKKGVGLGFISGGFFLPLLYDWIQFGIEPWKNKDSFGTMAIVGGASILLANKNKFFNKMPVKENKWQLKVFQF